MKTIRRLLYRDIVWSVVFVSLAFLSLFFFIDFVEELEDLGKGGYTASRAVLRSLLLLPGRFYELFPISVLIGTIYAMARLAQSSEFTILRTGGLGPGRALRLLSTLGLIFAAVTFVVGDYVAPMTDRQAVNVKAAARGGVSLGGAGAWLKERRQTPDGERAISVNVQSALGGSQLKGVRIYEFDADGRLRRRLQADTARLLDNGHWQLLQVQRTDWPTPDQAHAGQALTHSALAELDWPSSLDASVVAAALLPAKNMSTVDLWRYSQHLADQDQAAEQHQIQFWKKALYPLACLVMVALALPFAYLHARAGGISYKVFGGILLGISFVLLNNAAGHLGMLRQWTPWLVAAAPSLLYVMLSMGAFAWLVRYR